MAELEAMSPGALERTLVSGEQARRCLEAALLAIMDVAERRGIYAHDGHTSVQAWVRTLTNISPVEAAARARTMRACRDLELVRSRLAAGELGVEQVRVLARLHANPRCRDQLPDSEEVLVEQAIKLRFEALVTVARRWQQLADADGAHADHERRHARRHVHVVQVGDGFRLAGEVGAVQGSAMKQILDAFAQTEFHADWDAARAQWGDEVTKDRLARTDAQRRADALHAIFLAAASTPPGSQVPGPVLNVVMDHEWFEHELARRAGARTTPLDPSTVTSRRCQTTTGVPVDPSDALAAALVGHVRRVVVDSAGVVIDFGRKRRLFTGAARDAVLLADTHCTWGCCAVLAEHSQIDHSLDWVRDGATNPRNGGPRCGHHNRFKNHG